MAYYEFMIQLKMRELAQVSKDAGVGKGAT
jgi:hypothetical protein